MPKYTIKKLKDQIESATAEKKGTIQEKEGDDAKINSHKNELILREIKRETKISGQSLGGEGEDNTVICNPTPYNGTLPLRIQFRLSEETGSEPNYIIEDIDPEILGCLVKFISDNDGTVVSNYSTMGAVDYVAKTTLGRYRTDKPDKFFWFDFLAASVRGLYDFALCDF